MRPLGNQALPLCCWKTSGRLIKQDGRWRMAESPGQWGRTRSCCCWDSRDSWVFASQSETAESASTCPDVCLERHIYLNDKRAWEKPALTRAEDGRETEQGNFSRNRTTATEGAEGNRPPRAGSEFLTPVFFPWTSIQTPSLPPNSAYTIRPQSEPSFHLQRSRGSFDGRKESSFLSDEEWKMLKCKFSVKKKERKQLHTGFRAANSQAAMEAGK